jgi:hypothetical protein
MYAVPELPVAATVKQVMAYDGEEERGTRFLNFSNGRD